MQIVEYRPAQWDMSLGYPSCKDGAARDVDRAVLNKRILLRCFC